MKLTRLTQIAIAFDQMVNAMFRGWADETISARAHRKAQEGTSKWIRFEKFIDALFFWQEAHCKQAYESEQQRLQIAPEYREES